ncbi:MAG: rod shape-determining protein MreC [Candidatus Nomurabacteria bacterium]|nr:rod shape-determining protein MreC [Candidatus Nomurabacteria bacterium]
MSYLLDKKIKRNKFFKYAIFVAILLILIYFRAGVFRGLSYVSSVIFRPVLILGNSIGGSLSNTGAYFYSKNSLLSENENLKAKLNEQEARMSNYNSILDENLKIKETLGRKNGKTNLILTSILSKPNQSPYDTLVVDMGAKSGLVSGQKVFALGNVPIGRVAEVYLNTSKIILYSNPGEKTEVVISGHSTSNAFGMTGTGGDTFMQIVGRGGGNFEMILPRDFVLEKGTEVVLPGITPYTVGIVQTIISDPRDSFQKALLSSPVNIQELKFVEVEL